MTQIELCTYSYFYYILQQNQLLLLDLNIIVLVSVCQ